MKTYTVTKDNNGTIRWHNEDGQLHREDGPAVERANGTKAWYLNGQLHREGGPAIERADGSKEWWINGLCHREDGPAVEWANGDKEWYLNDQCHREDGPAVEWASGTKFWYLNGQRLTEEEFNKRPQPHQEILNKINRIEYIDSEGRRGVRYGKHSFSIEDNGQTLKIFKEGKV